MGERLFWRDHKKDFYSVRNPEYYKALKRSGVVNTQVRDLFGKKMELFDNNVSLIGDPIEKALGEAVDKAETEDKLEPINLDQLDEEPVDPINQNLMAIKVAFTNLVKGYRNNLEKGVVPSSLTATVKKNELQFAKQPIHLVYDEKFPSQIYIDIGKNPLAGRRFSNLGAFHLFASENLERTVIDKKIDRQSVIDFAVLLKRLGLLDRASAHNDKANYLREVLLQKDGKAALDKANNVAKTGKKGKERDVKGEGLRTKNVIKYYSDPDELVEKLYLIIASVQAGNASTALKNEAMDIISKLEFSRVLTKAEANKLMKKII